MSWERRSLRPFDGMERSQSLMRESVMLTSHDYGRDALHGQSLVLTEDEYLHEKTELWFGRHRDEQAALQKAFREEANDLYPWNPQLVRLVVSMSNTRLKMTDVVLDIPAIDLGATEGRIELAPKADGRIDQRPRLMRMPKDGCGVTVELLLGADVPPDRRQAGRAWRMGSWLARSTMKIRTSAGAGGPRPWPLTDSERERLRLPAECVQYTEILSNDSLLTASDFDDAIRFYVDAPLLEKVTGDPHTASAQHLQARWILEVTRSFIFAAIRHPDFASFDPTQEPWSASILRAMLDKVIDRSRIADITEAMEVLAADPVRFMAELEDRASMRAREHEGFGIVEEEV